MKKMFTGFISGLLIISAAFANTDLPEADNELLLNFKDYCQELSEDEGTGDLTLDQFLLVCINKELASEGFQAITKLPEEN
jgi:hypothetical protein